VVQRPNRNRKTERTQFGLIAAQIGSDIKDTADKLWALQQLAKNKSIFHDPAAEIQELTVSINQNIKNLNGQLSALEEQKNSNSGGSKQASTHSGAIVETLKRELTTTTKDFSEVLQLRTENLKSQQKERENFLGSPNSSLGARKESPLYKPSTFLENGDGSESNDNQHVAIQMPRSVLLSQDRYINDRFDAISSIQANIVELQSIFMNLSRLVASQGEMIQRIDSDLENTDVNIKTAQDQLMEYFRTVSSSRWLSLKLGAVFFLFIIFFVVFFV
jgi:syntaxin 5